MEETAKKDVELLKTLRTPEFAEFFNKKIELKKRKKRLFQRPL